MAIMFPIGPGSKGSHVDDIHRKLASIRHQLPMSCQEFLRGPCPTEFTPQTMEALKAFQSQDPELKKNADGICDRATWEALDRQAGSMFNEVWQFELDALRGRGVPQGVRPAEEDDLIRRAHAADLAGLALSGGGIRSATFNLGILQALATRGILRHFDYLSTVSGGGYIGGWFSKWLKRENGKLDILERKLGPGTPQHPTRHEAAEIGFLRKYSNYLTPKTGAFSADTWALLATYFRNTFLNLTIIVCLLAVLLLIPRLLSLLTAKYAPTHGAYFAWTAAGMALLAVGYIALSVSMRPNPRNRFITRALSQPAVLFLVTTPLVVAGFAGSVAIWEYRDSFAHTWGLIPPGIARPAPDWLLIPGLAYIVTWVVGFGLARLINRRFGPGVQGPSVEDLQATVRQRGRSIFWSRTVSGFGHFLFALVGLATGVLLTLWLVNSVVPAKQTTADAIVYMNLVVFGMPALLAIFGISMIVTIGLVGRLYSDSSREWWSRQGGWTTICVLVGFGLAAISLYGPPVIAYIVANVPLWTKAFVATTWFGTVAAGLILGRSNTTGKRDSSPYVESIISLAPPLFMVGALLIISTILYLSLLGHSADWTGHSWNEIVADYNKGVSQIDLVRLTTILVSLVGIGLLLSWRVDVNKFSLYMMYRNRLVRAYLGASNSARESHPFTGFDEKDDEYLDNLRDNNGKIQRPFHIINAALNLTNGKELAWQTRKAANFAFSPAFCGFELPSMAPPGRDHLTEEAARGCYRPTAGYRNSRRADEEVGVKLGMAVAVSGAAASPNMGYHSSPAIAFLMTLFNVRLGRWFANPLRRHWSSPAPWFGIKYLLKELFGMSDSQSGYLNLSDGGHFENLGIYELVRRRCKLIVVVDAGQDKGFGFEDLGNAIRKCGTDLHIEIDINVNQIECLPPNEFSKAYCVAGTILYDQTDADASVGTLLYIKPSLLGTECADILNYRKENPDFPHQSTGDQWFDETQFESYRALGYHVGMVVLGRCLDVGIPVPKTPGAAVTSLADAIQWAWGARRQYPTPVDSPATVWKKIARPKSFLDR